MKNIVTFMLRKFSEYFSGSDFEILEEGLMVVLVLYRNLGYCVKYQ